DRRTPEAIAFQPLKRLGHYARRVSSTRGIAALLSVFVARMRKVGKHDGQRHERHQRADTAAGFDNFELLRFPGSKGHQFNYVSLSQYGNIKERHGPYRTTRCEELQREGYLIEI